MTLSRFLRDYLYIPLGGNRYGGIRRYGNLMIVMLLGGLWHGAGWTFVLWGGLHGIYLVINHAWRGICRSAGIELNGKLWQGTAVLITFAAVVLGWVFFRAANFETAMAMIRGMVGLNGAAIPAALAPAIGPAAAVLGRLGVAFTLGGGAQFVKMYAWIFALLPIVFIAPNTQQLLGRYRPGLDFVPADPSSEIQWSPTRRWAVAGAALAAVGILSITRHSEFLYFQF